MTINFPYVKVEISGSRELVESVKDFLSCVMDWLVVDDLKSTIQLLAVHGVHNEYERKTFWLIQKMYKEKLEEQSKTTEA